MVTSNKKAVKQRWCEIIIIMTIFLIFYTHIAYRSEDKKCDILDRHDNDRKRSKHRISNKILTDYDADIKRKFQQAVDLKMEPSDPKLHSLILEMMDAPSSHLIKASTAQRHTPQSKYVDSKLNKKKGFFIECGAMDGETSSNTFMLEIKKQWTGLLIEPDPYMYTQLLGKNRHAWSINAGLSSTKYPQWLTFAEDKGQRGMIIDKVLKKPGFLEGPERKVPCLPIEAMLMALNVTQVDYFSLDIEGMEEYFLQSLVNSKLDIKIWTIEYDKIGKEKLNAIMQNLGYKSIHQIDHSDSKLMSFAHDIVFMKI